MSYRGRLTWIPLCLIGLTAFVLIQLRESEPLQAGVKADSVLVDKQTHTMTLFHDGKPLKTYRVALGRGGLGSKSIAGDNKVPDGIYRIAGRNPHSAFHRALRVGYPTSAQVIEAHTRGIDPGGGIMIHGIKNGFGWLGSLQREVDWTKGCIAVTDREMDEIWAAVPDGTLVEIRP